MGKGSGCEVVAEVLIEMAANPATPWYLCASSGGNPGVCSTSAAYTALLKSRAFMELNKTAADKGCQIAVQAGKKIVRIAVVEAVRTVEDVKWGINRAKRTYRATDSYDGMSQLMNFLRRF